MAPKFSKNGKRLGRPPKNAGGVVFPAVVSPVLAQTTTSVAPQTIQQAINKDNVPVQIPLEQQAPELITESMIQCEFVPVTQHVFHSESDTKKLGLYSSSNYRLSQLDNNRWVVLAYLKADFEKYRAAGLSNKDIIGKCVNYLNAVEPKKKYAKKNPVPKYGNLTVFNEEVNFTNKFGFECAILALSTDERKCDYFWGEGVKYF